MNRLRRRGVLLALTASLLVPLWPAQAWADETPTRNLQVTRKKSLITILQCGRDPRNAVFTDALVAVGRFDYYNLSYRNEWRLPSVDEMRDKFARYLTDNAAAIAGKGKKPDLKFGDVVVSGEDLDRLIDSAYVMIPSWEMGGVSLSEGKTVVDKEGVEKTETTASAPMTLVNEIVNLRTGAVVGTQTVGGSVSKTITLRIPPNVSESKKRRLTAEYEAERMAAKIAVPERYFADDLEGSARYMMPFFTTQVRRMDLFVLRSLVSDRDPRRMTLGRDMGVLPDSTWTVYRKQDHQMVNVGFVKVREIGDADSGFQPILDTVGFEPGDQLIEHPRAGFDGAVRLGMATLDMQGGGLFAPSLGFVSESNLAMALRAQGLTEWYGTAEGWGLLPMNANVVGWEGNVGLKKRFYVQQVAWSIGLKAGLVGTSGEVGTTTAGVLAKNGDVIPKGASVRVSSTAVGVSPCMGVEYQPTPDLKFGAEVGLRLFTPLLPSDTVTVSNSSADYQYALKDLPASLVPKTGNASGLALSVGISYSF